MVENFNQIIGLSNDHSWITPDWDAPKNVRAIITTRAGGVSQGAFEGLNVGAHVGDSAEAVVQNREIVRRYIGKPVAYLEQVHGTHVVRARDALNQAMAADAVVDNDGAVACAVMTADCLPVLFCDVSGTVVAAAHAGWRGLANGVLQNTVRAMGVTPSELMAYFGPAIGAEAFEVGDDVFESFVSQNLEAKRAFVAVQEGKYLADIHLLARQILQSVGVERIWACSRCTVLERDSFFSYRRDGQTGRMLSAIWLAND